MLAKAKQAARMQMEIEKLNTCRFATAVPPKASRFLLNVFLKNKVSNGQS
ncbi:unnamed protein product [Gongylonema pulchrum]|uniref:Uncharacterized protein n=1 Tax=Gongylonema pulchrum TaxID=637853 RepID=A0A183DIA6_9BILA|nr:unnamed protein product [Gongylonema pulchrum]